MTWLLNLIYSHRVMILKGLYDIYHRVEPRLDHDDEDSVALVVASSVSVVLQEGLVEKVLLPLSLFSEL